MPGPRPASSVTEPVPLEVLNADRLRAGLSFASVRSLRTTSLLLCALAVGTSLTACGSSSPSPRKTTAPVVPTPTCGVQPNFIPNPCVATDLKYWEPYSTSSALYRSTRVKKIGPASLEVVTKKAEPFGVKMVNAVGYPAKGGAFTLSAFVKSLSHTAGKTLTLEIVETGGATGPGITALATKRLASTWRRLAVSGFVKRADRTELTVFFYIRSSLAVNDGFYLSGIALQLKPKPKKQPRPSRKPRLTP